MSASREKRTRQDQTAQGSDQARLTRQAEEQKEKTRTILYIAVGAVCAVCVAALLIWNSNLLRNSAAAVTINGQKYTAADVQYYYNGLRYQAYLNGLIDYGAPAKDQVYDKETGQTWHDYLLEQAVETLKRDVALADAAAAEGYVLSQESADSLQSNLDSLETGWITSGYGSRDAFLKANYGSGMTYQRYQTLVNRAALAGDYYADRSENAGYTQEELEACYEENKDLLDTYVLSQYVFLASAAEAQEATEDTPAVEAVTIEQAKAAARTAAEELQAALEAGGDPAALAEEFADEIFVSYLDQEYTGSSLSGATFSGWLFDGARRAGDVTLAENDYGTNCYYYVIRYEDRYRDDSRTADARHILVSAGSLADNPDQAAFDAAYEEAEALLEQWKSGEATEETFAQLAEENSADTSSAANGGLISNISSNSGYVDTFKDWALDPARRSGDTGIVRNDGSSIVGWHVMYFVDWGAPIWQQNAASLLTNGWVEALGNGYSAQTGSGLRYVG